MPTTQQILNAVEQQRGLAYDPAQIRAYQAAGGTLVNGAIPTVSGGENLIANQARVANQGKKGYDVLGVPVSGTVASSETGEALHNNEVAKTDNLVATGAQGSGGEFTNSEGIQVTDGGKNYAPVPETATPRGDGTFELNGLIYKQDPSIQQWSDYEKKVIEQTDAQTAQLLSGIQAQFNMLIARQEEINRAAEAGQMRGLLMGGGQFAPLQYESVLAQEKSYGLSQIAALNMQEQNLLLQAQQAAQDKKTTVLKEVNDKIQGIRDAKKKVAQEQADKAAEVTQKLNEEQRQANQDAAITEVISSTKSSDPVAIYSALQKNGRTDITMEDVTKYMKSVADATGAKNSNSVHNAIEAFYSMKDTVGGLPTDILALPDEGSQLLEWIKRYNAAEVKPTPSTIASITTDEVDSTSQSILAQTGLSGNAFFWLTGRSSQLPRDQATRNAAAAEATAWANKNGVDISTLPAQYEAYNKVLAFNTTRQSMAVVQENEILATIENLKAVSPTGDISKLNFANVAKIWAGQQVNDPIAQQYAFHLGQLRNEIVAYNLIAQGQINSDGSLKMSTENDLAEATKIIKNGVASGSLNGLTTAVTNSTDKMRPILQQSLDSARKAIWNLFGVGQNYKAPQPKLGGSNANDFLNNPAPNSTATSTGASFWGNWGNYQSPLP